MAESALQTQQLSVQINGKWLLHDVNVQLPQGQWTAIVGPNGAGKSTLLRALAGLQSPRQTHGQVLLQGKDLLHWDRTMRARALAWMGQSEAIPAELTSYDVVMLGRMPHQRWLAGPSAQDRLVVQQSMAATQCWAWRHRPLAQLSGGERQRVLLARTLAVQAQVVLMDEPLSNLDPPHQSDWMHTVQHMVGQGQTVISVLHELGIALQADHMVVVQAGRVVHSGRTEDAATHRALEAVFAQRIRIRQMDGMWMALPVAGRIEG